MKILNILTTAAQERFLGSLFEVVLDNRIALDYLLAGQGSACVMAKTTCCTWIHTSGEAETQIGSLGKPFGLKE